MHPTFEDFKIWTIPLGLKCQFLAMASQCEIVLHDSSMSFKDLEIIAKKCFQEIKRIERKYSRYVPDSVIGHINQSSGKKAQPIDLETYELLSFANELFQNSQGLFDITSGILRKAWNFKQGIVPDQKKIAKLLPLISWSLVDYSQENVFLPIKDMEIDFGGFGKEYAADRVAKILTQEHIKSGYVNLAGDIKVVGPKLDGESWQMGIQHPRINDKLIASIPIHLGALATSGDYERFFIQDNHRYCHILRPDTGCPVNYWQSVSVLAPLTIVAGSCSTIAMLMQKDALNYLDNTGFSYLAIDKDGQFYKK